MPKTADEIIQVVITIQQKTEELEKLYREKEAAERALRKFEDTGNAHLHVSFNHDGRDWETPYTGDQYPSDKVRNAVVEDIKSYNAKRFAGIEKLEKEINELKRSLEAKA